MELTQIKKEEAIKELKEWLGKSDSKDFYFLNCKKSIEDNLKEDVLMKSTMVEFKTMDHWFTNNFAYEMLTDGQSNYRLDMTSNGYHILVLADKFGDIYANKNPPFLLFHKVAFWLANTFILNWKDKSRELVEIINKNLNTGVLKGGWEIKPSSWFILEIANKAFGLDYNLSKFNYPNNMGVYQNALGFWDTKDLDQLDSIASSLCDYHLENATYGKEETTPGIQFGDSPWFVYAFEILTWLRAREIMGLNNPEKFTHPLMQLAINQLPKNPISVVDDELFLQALEKLDT